MPILIFLAVIVLVVFAIVVIPLAVIFAMNLMGLGVVTGLKTWFGALLLFLIFTPASSFRRGQGK